MYINNQETKRARGSSTFWSFSRLAVQEPLRLPNQQSSVFRIPYLYPTHSPHQTHSSTPFASTPNTLHTFSPPTLSPTSPLALALSTPPPCPPSDSPSSSPPAWDHPSNRPASPLSGKAPQGSGVRFRETIFHGHSRMKRGRRWRSR